METKYVITSGLGTSMKVFAGWDCGFLWVPWDGESGRMYISHARALANLMACCQRYGNMRGVAEDAIVDTLQWESMHIRIQRVTRSADWKLS